ncbi:hypothetical protein M153_956000840 [Pseudoloma neurophilia]|uniref:Uncharacterized protein n=1 Tax=Pseudoloma neurophilia TaxID=146866 RepID=A0A0R0LVJ9_9MICR|nr:hypothetical protein M153_956000840 [Pseudoloma neurophilia]
MFTSKRSFIRSVISLVKCWVIFMFYVSCTIRNTTKKLIETTLNDLINMLMYKEKLFVFNNDYSRFFFQNNSVERG